MSRTAHSSPDSEHTKDPGANKWIDYATRQSQENEPRLQASPSSSLPPPRLSESRSFSHEQQYRPFLDGNKGCHVMNDKSNSTTTRQPSYQPNLCHANIVKPRELSDHPLCFCGKIASERKAKKEGDITVYECGYNQHQGLTSSIVICTFHMHKGPWLKYQWRMRKERPVFQDDDDLSSCDMFNYTFCVLFQAHNTFPLRPLRTPLCYCNVPAEVYSCVEMDHRYFAGCHTDLKCLWTLPAEDIRVLRIPWINNQLSQPSLVATEEDALIYTKKGSPVMRAGGDLNLLPTTGGGADILRLLQKTKVSSGDDNDNKEPPFNGENDILKLLQETKLSPDNPSLSADDSDSKNDDVGHTTHNNDNDDNNNSITTNTTTSPNMASMSPGGTTSYVESNSGLEGLRRRLEQLQKKVQRVRMENQRYRDQCSDTAASESDNDTMTLTHVPCRTNETVKAADLHDSPPTPHMADDLPQEEDLGINADQQSSLTTNIEKQHRTMLLQSLMLPLDMADENILGHTTQQMKSDTEAKKGDGQ
ncbi:hypothetical protein O0I10_001631 [Lichtheimia ornata]|uniref:Uncharacterized protein n=1 Tax=Lichtheimia ornata TaxID=688661 RepID=A0AAD7VBJ8_9FUNG|nr:uncharacterized protein O0I10_001631 [Lichtheimia ornata]KAJ8662667.1 hypothetical protein O0I10_001631 [Lichtheimia ornata]